MTDGLWITFEGGDGSGKTTQAELLREWFEQQGRAVVRTRGVWAGLFAHWATMFPVVAFALMWGVPYMRAGNGISAGGASAVLVVGVVAVMLLTIGMRRPQQGARR